MYTTNKSDGMERPILDKYDRFELWLRENGAQFDMVRRHSLGTVLRLRHDDNTFMGFVSFSFG
jgi:hypothetical protein